MNPASLVLLAGLLLPGGLSPNLVVILADDLGFSDVGDYGGEIETPHLDGLAQGGLRFTQFTNTARCWPTRAALLTGYYAQQVRRDRLPGVKSGAGGTRPAWARLLPARLAASGYRSYHSGKWHVDGPVLAAGFDRSYRLADHGRFFSPVRHLEDDEPLPPVEPGSGYYATTAIAEHAIESLRDHAARHADRPFFLYLAFTAPHFPLHARPEDIARYRGRYDAGWDRVREERWERQRKLGVFTGAFAPIERGVGPPYAFPDALERLGPGEFDSPAPWTALGERQRAFQSAKMELHAAMVDRMDREIGRVLDQLRAMDAWGDTLILFLSDNGASAEIMVRDDGHDPSATPGSAASHLCLGPGWSSASNTPFRRHKTWVHQGGIATPLIAHWPDGISARGELRHDPGHVVDLAPTLLALAGSAPIGAAEDEPAPPGRTLVPTFAADNGRSRPPLWWSHEGNHALRDGDWKLVSDDDGRTWELFDLRTDPAEARDLAAEQPERVEEMARTWHALREEIRAVATRDLPAQEERRR